MHDIPATLVVSPRVCAALATLLEDDRTFGGLFDALVYAGVPDGEAERLAESFAAEVLAAPRRAVRPARVAPAPKVHVRVVTSRGEVHVGGVPYAHDDLACLAGRMVRVTFSHALADLALVSLFDGTRVCAAEPRTPAARGVAA